MSSVSALYESLIARDLEAIEPAVRAFRKSASADDLFLAIARFAVLSFAPSQHAKHAMLAVLSAWELRGELGERFDDMLVQCARYAAGSRQPWSEPPITDPPAVDPSAPRDLDELRAAVRERDRLRGERWLAARLDDDDLKTLLRPRPLGRGRVRWGRSTRSALGGRRGRPMMRLLSSLSSPKLCLRTKPLMVL
jgi:hypothetical protein